MRSRFCASDRMPPARVARQARLAARYTRSAASRAGPVLYDPPP